MLTQTALMATIKHNSAYGLSGGHHFGHGATRWGRGLSQEFLPPRQPRDWPDQTDAGAAIMLEISAIPPERSAP